MSHREASFSPDRWCNIDEKRFAGAENLFPTTGASPSQRRPAGSIRTSAAFQQLGRLNSPARVREPCPVLALAQFLEVLAHTEGTAKILTREWMENSEPRSGARGADGRRSAAVRPQGQGCSTAIK